MKKNFPWPMWIALISLGMMVVGKIIFAFERPMLLIDAVLSIILLVGLSLGHKWAYIATLASVAFVVILISLTKGPTHALIILVIDSIVYIPMIICTRCFFPLKDTD